LSRLLIGVDIGTSGTKTIIMNEKGDVLRSKTVEYDTIVLKPGWSEMRAETWWEATVETLGHVLDGIDKSKLAGLSFSGQMHGMVAMDENMQVVRPAILWNDGRNQAQCDEITAIAGGLEGLLKYTNNKMLAGYTGGKILWMKQNEPENYAKTKLVLNPKDYIRYMLTGDAATEASDASGTGLFDVKNRRFCWELIDKVGLERSLFPKCFESSDITGAISAKAAELTGLPQGLPVVGGGGDAVIQTTGTGLVKQGVLGIVLGTSGVAAMGLDSFFENDGSLQLFCNNAKDLWHAMGITMSAGGSYKWFKDTFCQEEAREAAEKGANVYDLINAKAETAPAGCEGLFFLPHINGSRCPYSDPNARGTFVGISQRTDKGAMARSVMEGVAYSSREISELIFAMDESIVPSKIIASGGGASSPLWRQIISDIFNLPVYTLSGSSEGGAYAAALVAGVGVGVFRDLEDAIKVLKEESLTLPREKEAATYEKSYQVYKSLYPALKSAFDSIAEL
jgi:xylulokinase